MGIVRNISYHTIQTDHADQAASLSFYLNEHGLCSQAEGDAVTLPVPDVETYNAIELLKQSWSVFWDHSDTGLFGLAIYEKEGV